MRKKRMQYPTDLTESQWQYIKKTMNLKDRKRKYSLLVIWNALMYLLKTGCQWRMLPEEFPKWRTVHAYFAIWSEPREGGSLLEQALKKSGWRGPRETGAQRLKQVLDRGRAEREEHGHGGQQGL